MLLKKQNIRCSAIQVFHLNFFRVSSPSLFNIALRGPKMKKGPIVLGVQHSKPIQRQCLPALSKEELDLTSTGINGKTHVDFRRH